MKSNKKQVRRGHCENYTNCALADSGDIQEVQAGDDFVCSLCGKELVEEPTPKKNWIWFCLGAVVIIAIVLLSIRMCSNHNPDSVVIIDTIYNECGDTLYLKGTDTLDVKKNTRIDTLYNDAGDTIMINGCGDTIDIKPKQKEPEPPVRGREGNNGGGSVSRVLPVYGKYDGPRNGSGEPHGKGGQVEVTIEYHWGYHVFSPGDRIVNTTYENGQLQHGKVITKDGNSYSI